MKKLTLLLAIIAMVFTTTSCFSQKDKVSKVQWMSVQDAVKQGQKDGKKAKLIFIDCYTSWCGWCKVLDSKSFSNDTIVAILNYYYYPCKFDAEGNDIVNINNITYNPNKKGGRGATHDLMKVIWEGQKGAGYPTLSIRQGNFAPIDCIMGFLGPEDLQPTLIYYAEGFNKEMSWEKFSKEYVTKHQKNILKKIFKK